MREDITPAVQRALHAAAEWAKRLGREAAGPAELLLGLLDEEEGRAAGRVIAAGLSLEVARTSLLHHPIESITLDAVLTAASLLTRERRGERLSHSEDVLQALLRTSPAVRTSLQAAGLNLAAVEAAVAVEAGPPLRPDEPLEFTEVSERMDTAHILDAGANRAHRALRVIEDYCRFALDDAFLSREAKTLRHDLAGALEAAGSLPLLAARDTLGDVGTAISTPTEDRRDSPLDVVRVNLKRLQEALRSLEEFGKLIRPELGSALEQLRYRVYTLEQAIVLGHEARQRLAEARLYLLLTGSACAASLDFVIAEAAAGGVDIVQLREKNLSDGELLQRARQVRRWTREAGVLFIVNDRPDVARLAEADGVHLGQDDMPVREARRIVGGDALIGVSTHTLDQLHRAIRDGANYVGVGPVFPSATKEFAELAGLEFVRQAAEETSLPAFSLGGITAEELAASRRGWGKANRGELGDLPGG